MAKRFTFREWWVYVVEQSLTTYGYSRPGGFRSVFARAIRAIGRALYVTRRFSVGARSVDCAEPTSGSYVDPFGYVVEFSGMCPVQGEGQIDNREIYYRSRGEGWSFSVAKPRGDVFADDAWYYSEHDYFFPDGGYVSPDVSRACIEKALRKWRLEGCP